jgi:hypothetical protein
MGEVSRLATFLCVLALGAASASAAGAAYANERSSEVVSSFRMFCTPGPPDFAALDAKATAMKLSVRKDVAAPQQPGQSARSKSWLVSLAGGRHELVASEARGPNGEFATCGVGAEDVDGEDLRHELIDAMKLGAPLRQSFSADGAQRLTVWKFPGDLSLMLADGTPMKIPGMYLTLVHQTNTSH